MAQGVSIEYAGVGDGSVVPAAMANAILQGGRVRGYQATFDLSSSAVKRANGDTNVCFRLPKGCHPFALALNASVTMGANATIAVGSSATPGKYRAAATFTAAALTFSMLSTASDDAPLTDYEDVIITVGHADGLPSSGILQVYIFTLAR